MKSRMHSPGGQPSTHTQNGAQREGPVRLLLVDDESGMRALGVAFLRKSGLIQPDTAKSAEEALDKIRAAEYDVIVSDYQMTGMDGLELLQEVRKVSRVPFILFTGRGREEVVIEALNSGADFYLQKGAAAEVTYAELEHKVLAAVDRRRTFEALKESEQRLFDIISFLPDATLAIDRNGHVIAWNRAIEEMTGVPAGEMLGKGDFTYAIPFYGRARPILIDLIMTGGAVIGLPDYRVLTRQDHAIEAETDRVVLKGIPVVLFIKASPLYDRTGSIIGAIESIRDITAQKKAEAALRASEEQYRLLVDTTGTGFAVLDDDGTLLDSNEEYARLTGRTDRDRIRDHSFLEWTAPYEYERNREAFSTLLQEGSLKQYEVDYQWPDGTIVPVEVNAAVMTVEGHVRVLGLVRDISGRRQAERKSRDQELMFRGIVETSPSLLTLSARNGRNLYISQNCEEFTGYRPDEVMASWLWWVHPDDRDRVEKVLTDAISGSQSGRNLEYLARKKDGSAWHASSSWEVLECRSGPGGQLLVQTFDISLRKEMEERLAESEFMYRTILEEMQDGFYRCDLTGKLLMVSPSGARMLGYESPGEMTGRNIVGTFTEDMKDRDTLMSILNRHGSITDLEMPLKKKDGSSIVVSTRSHWVRDGEGWVVGIEGTFRDITGEKQIRQRLVESESLYRSLVEHSQDGVFIVRDGRMAFCNRAFASMIGYGTGELSDREISGLIAPESREMVMERYRRRLAGEEVPEHYDFSMIKKDGVTRVHVSMTVGVIPYEGGLVSMGTVHDVTRRKQAEEALLQTNRKLGLISSITRHDIANQVTALEACLDLLGEEEAPEARAQLLNRARSVTETIAKHLSFTTDYEDVGSRAPVWQEAGRVISGVISANHAIITENRVAGLEVLADPLLPHVFLNLLENSILHGRGTTRVQFFTGPCPEGIAIICEDDGRGVAADRKEKIFERGIGEHTGLGLFLCREVLAITGITLTETGRQGAGARFEMRVPKGAYRLLPGDCEDEPSS